MRKLNSITAARLVKQKNGDWYIVWYANGERFRHKFGLNRIQDLSEREIHAKKIIHEINTGKATTPDAVSFVVQPDFSVFFKKYISERENVLQPGTIKTIRLCYNRLADFAKQTLNKEFPDFSDLDATFPLLFQNWAYASKRAYSRNYTSKILSQVKGILLAATEQNVTDCVFFTSTIKKTKTDNIALTFADIQKLKSLKLEGMEERVRDIFVFAALTGLRFSDLKTLDSRSFTKIGPGIDAVYVNTQKTGAKVLIPLHQFALDVVKKNGMALPSVPCMQTFNRKLKEICKKAGFTEGVKLQKNKAGKTKSVAMERWECISSHSARRTFATVAYQEFGVPAAVIMQITGHSSERQLFEYIKQKSMSAALDLFNYFKKLE